MQYRNERIADLRHLLRMTQGELAASVDMNASYLSKIESSNRTLTHDIVSALALRHHIPISFFTVEDPIPNFGAPTFRKKASAPVKETRFVEVLQKLAMRLFHIVSLKSGYVSWVPPVPDDIGDPEAAALHAREHFSIGPTAPIRNVIRLLERNGAGVIGDLSHTVSEGVISNHHGVTRPHARDDRPVVALFDSGRGDVNRLTAAHELGHLIFDHRGDLLSQKDRETRAFRFGSAFLFPAAVAQEWITPDLPLSGYLAIKAQYGISASAAIYRGKDLGLIDHDRYRSLMIQHSSRGWRTREPGHVEPEKPLLLTQAIGQIWPNAPIRMAATETGIPARILEHWTGLATAEVPAADSSKGNIVDLAAARASRGG